MIEFLKNKYGMVQFLMDVVKHEDCFIDMHVYKVTSWTLDDAPLEHEIYLKASVKWDGCSHIEFGHAGYLHFCGKNSWDVHSRLMSAIYEYAKINIKAYDVVTAES